MKKWILAMAMALLWNTAVFAAGTEYQLRVDGLACPYCAYGIEKKLKQVEGVEAIDIDLNKGVVTVKCAEGVTLTEAQMAKLINDAGFTLRGMTEKPL
jgi:mercuric ion binding protein